MEQKQISRFLLLAVGAAMAGLAVVFLGFSPITLWSARAWLGGWAAALGTAYALGIGGLYFGALRLYMTICRRIGQGRSFCAENAAGLDRIGRLLLAAAGLWLLGEAGYAVADLTPDDPKYSPAMAGDMINAGRYGQIEALRSTRREQASPLIDLVNRKYDERLALYRSGQKQWDTETSITLVVRGVKEG